MGFKFEPQAIPGVILVTPDTFPDSRGWFNEVYKAQAFHQAGIKDTFTQINQSYSTQGVLRGLHYQKTRSAQGKLVRVVFGEIFDVAVDIRRGSPYYGCWVGEYLSDQNKAMLFIPRGFAHGFCVVSKTAQIEYYCTAEYDPNNEAGIIYNDSTIKIDWPGNDFNLSPKDLQFPALADADNDFIYEK